MTKEKWIELFKIINDRLPNDKEIAEALAKGEFTVEHDYYKVSNEEDVKKLMRGELYIGRAKEQVEEFVSEYIEPILKDNQKELNLSVEIAL